jgi:NADPH2:quinone reductase
MASRTQQCGMQAWRVHDVGEPAAVLVREEVDPPTGAALAGMAMDLAGWVPMTEGREPFTDWVLLAMKVAALALPDVTTARGTYPVPVARPYIPGQEGVGTVIDAAPGRQHLVGKRVAAITMQPWGSLAETSVGISQIVEVPAGLSDEEGAGFLIPAHTAYHAAIRRGQVRAGETVLVLGAAGGLGSAMVQLCVAQSARVIAVVGGPDKVAFVERLGAEGVDHTAGDFVAAVRSRTNGLGVDAILDPVQGEMGAAARQVLVPDGRHVLCGHAGTLIPHDPHFYMYNHTLVGATLGSYPRDRMRQIHDETHAALAALLEQGRYRPMVERCVPFDEVPAALTALAERRTMGRVVVRIAA